MAQSARDSWGRLVVLILLLTGLCLQTVAADEGLVRERMPNGKTAVATWYPGEADKPPVLILHGFLQTREFPTVARLGASLAEEGYPVLLPTLTLGVDDRRKSLPCEAIHLHDMPGDADEVAHWVRWLHRKTGKPVTVIGHSAGSSVLLAMAERHPELPVRQMILVSLLHYEGGPVESGNRPSPEKGGLGEYHIAFCKRYPAPPEAFESYRAWDDQRTLKALHDAPWPTTVILGGADGRVSPAWRARLSRTPAKLV
ncbi:MAG: alpha/beta fold hydrolase, partial [Gammaproteobacteria bacterium]